MATGSWLGEKPCCGDSTKPSSRDETDPEAKDDAPPNLKAGSWLSSPTDLKETAPVE